MNRIPYFQHCINAIDKLWNSDQINNVQEMDEKKMYINMIIKEVMQKEVLFLSTYL